MSNTGAPLHIPKIDDGAPFAGELDDINTGFDIVNNFAADMRPRDISAHFKGSSSPYIGDFVAWQSGHVVTLGLNIKPDIGWTPTHNLTGTKLPMTVAAGAHYISTSADAPKSFSVALLSNGNIRGHASAAFDSNTRIYFTYLTTNLD